MDQVSRPTLIALLATILFASVWFVALRPKPAAVEDASPVPAVVESVDKAKETQAGADAAAARNQAATPEGAAAAPAVPGAAGTSPSAGAQAAAGATGAAAPQGRLTERERNGEKIVLGELDEGKVVVLLFWDKKGADDRATREAVKSISRREGKVAVHITPIEHVARFERITRGVTVAQSPTTLVISPDRSARSIVGLTEPTEVDQAVRDALAAKK
jgi:hypothetical protein